MAKKRFYGNAVTSGASALSVQMPGLPSETGQSITLDGVGVTMAAIKHGIIGTTEQQAAGGPFIPACDVARIASIVVPAGVHAIINFQDGRQFVCYCADKPVKVKPSMLAPAHAWRNPDDNETVLFTYLICDATGVPFIGSGATAANPYFRKASGLQVNVAVRSY